MSVQASTPAVSAPAAEADAQPHVTPSADAPEPEEKRPELKRVDQVRAFLKNKRAATEQKTQARLEARSAKPKEEPEPSSGPVDADAEAKPKAEAKPEEKPKPKAEAKPEPESKGPERDDNGRFLSKGEPKPATQAEAKPEPKPEQAEAKPEPKPEAKPEPPKTKPGLEEKHARLLLDVKRKDEEMVSLREKAKKADEYEKLIERVSGAEIDGEALAKLTKRSFESMVRDLKEGKAKYKPHVQLPPQLQAAHDEVAQLTARLRKQVEDQEKADREKSEAAAKAEAEAKRKANEEKETAIVASKLEELADKFPIVSSYGRAPKRILNEFYHAWAANTIGENGEPTFDFNKQPDLEEVISKMEDLLVGDVHGILSSERAWKRVLQDPKIKELVSRLMGEETPKPQPKNSPKRSEPGNQVTNVEGPRTLSNKVTQETPVVQEKPMTPEEKSSWRVEQWRRLRAQGRTGIKAKVT